MRLNISKSLGDMLVIWNPTLDIIRNNPQIWQIAQI